MRAIRLLTTCAFLLGALAHADEMVQVFANKMQGSCQSANSLTVKKVLIGFLKSSAVDDACGQESILTFLKPCGGDSNQVCKLAYQAYLEAKNSFEGRVVGGKQ